MKTANDNERIIHETMDLDKEPGFTPFDCWDIITIAALFLSIVLITLASVI